MQILPFCSEETLAKLEENILKMRPISDAPSDCKVSDIVDALLDGVGVGSYNEAVSHLLHLYHPSVFSNDHGVCWFVSCPYLSVIGGSMESIFG